MTLNNITYDSFSPLTIIPSNTDRKYIEKVQVDACALSKNTCSIIFYIKKDKYFFGLIVELNDIISFVLHGKSCLPMVIQFQFALRLFASGTFQVVVVDSC